MHLLRKKKSEVKASKTGSGSGLPKPLDFSRFPPEIWLHIFALLDKCGSKLQHIAHTCRLFRDLCLPLQYRVVHFDYISQNTKEMAQSVRHSVFARTSGVKNYSRITKWSSVKGIMRQARFHGDKLEAWYPICWSSPAPQPALLFLYDPTSPVYGYVREVTIPRIMTEWNKPLHQQTLCALGRMRGICKLALMHVRLDQPALDLVLDMPELEELDFWSPSFVPELTPGVQPRRELKTLTLANQIDARAIEVVLSVLPCRKLESLEITFSESDAPPPALFQILQEHIAPNTLRCLKLAGDLEAEAVPPDWVHFLRQQNRVTCFHSRNPFSLAAADVTPALFPSLRNFRGGSMQSQILAGRPVEKVDFTEIDASTDFDYQRCVLQPLRASVGPVRQLRLHIERLAPWHYETLSESVPSLESLTLEGVQAIENLTGFMLRPTWLAGFITLRTLNVFAWLSIPHAEDKSIPALTQRRDTVIRLSQYCASLSFCTFQSVDFVRIGQEAWKGYLPNDDRVLPLTPTLQTTAWGSPILMK